MLTITPEYAAHIFDLYINWKENAKLSGDRMKMLMLTLTFLVYMPIPYLLYVYLPADDPPQSHRPL